MRSDLIRVDPEFKKFIRAFKDKNEFLSDRQATREMMKVFKKMETKNRRISRDLIF